TAQELPAQQLGRVHLRDDLAIEVGARAPAEVLVRRTCVAVGTSMETSTVGVHAETETDVGAVVLRDDGLRVFLEDLELCRGGLAEPLGVYGLPGVGRV